MTQSVISKLNQTIEAHDSVLHEMSELKKRNEELRTLRDELIEGQSDQTRKVIGRELPSYPIVREPPCHMASHEISRHRVERTGTFHTLAKPVAGVKKMQ